jgi:hypothetical protein
MADYITLSCPSCGHKLQITEDLDRFACSACGNEHIVNRSGGIVSLKPVIESIQRLQVGVDKTAAELAIVRLRNEISQLGAPIEHSEVVRLLSGNVLRMILFMQAYEKMRGIQRTGWDRMKHSYTKQDVLDALSTLSDVELLNLSDFIPEPLNKNNINMIKSTLTKLVNTRIREEKLKEIASYYEIVRDNK